MKRQTYLTPSRRLPKAPLPFTLPSLRREAGGDGAGGGIAGAGAKWASPKVQAQDVEREDVEREEKTVWGGAGVRVVKSTPDFPELSNGARLKTLGTIKKKDADDDDKNDDDDWAEGGGSMDFSEVIALPEVHVPDVPVVHTGDYRALQQQNAPPGPVSGPVTPTVLQKARRGAAGVAGMGRNIGGAQPQSWSRRDEPRPASGRVLVSEHQNANVDLAIIESQKNIMKTKAELAQEARRRAEEERERLQKERSAAKLRELEERLKLRENQKQGEDDSRRKRQEDEKREEERIREEQRLEAERLKGPRTVLRRPKEESPRPQKIGDKSIVQKAPERAQEKQQENRPVQERPRAPDRQTDSRPQRQEAHVVPYRRGRNMRYNADGRQAAAAPFDGRRRNNMKQNDYDAPGDNETREQWLERRRKKTEARDAVRSVLDLLINRAVYGYRPPKRQHSTRSQPRSSAYRGKREHTRRDQRDPREPHELREGQVTANSKGHVKPRDTVDRPPHSSPQQRRKGTETPTIAASATVLPAKNSAPRPPRFGLNASPQQQQSLPNGRPEEVGTPAAIKDAFKTLPGQPPQRRVAPAPLRPAPWAPKPGQPTTVVPAVSPIASELKADAELQAAKTVAKRQVGPPMGDTSLSSELPVEPRSSVKSGDVRNDVSKNWKSAPRRDRPRRLQSDMKTDMGAVASPASGVQQQIKSVTIPPALGGNVKVLLKPPGARRDSNVTEDYSRGPSVTHNAGGPSENRPSSHPVLRGRGGMRRGRGGRYDYVRKDRREDIRRGDANNGYGKHGAIANEKNAPGGFPVEPATMSIARDEREDSKAWAASQGPAPPTSFDEISRAFSNQPPAFPLAGAPRIPPVPVVKEIKPASQIASTASFENKDAWSTGQSWPTGSDSIAPAADKWWPSGEDNRRSSEAEAKTSSNTRKGETTPTPADQKRGSNEVLSSQRDGKRHSRKPQQPHRPNIPTGPGDNRIDVSSRQKQRKPTKNARKPKKRSAERTEEEAVQNLSTTKAEGTTSTATSETENKNGQVQVQSQQQTSSPLPSAVSQSLQSSQLGSQAGSAGLPAAASQPVSAPYSASKKPSYFQKGRSANPTFRGKHRVNTNMHSRSQISSKPIAVTVVSVTPAPKKTVETKDLKTAETSLPSEKETTIVTSDSAKQSAGTSGESGEAKKMTITPPEDHGNNQSRQTEVLTNKPSYTGHSNPNSRQRGRRSVQKPRRKDYHGRDHYSEKLNGVKEPSPVPTVANDDGKKKCPSTDVDHPDNSERGSERKETSSIPEATTKVDLTEKVDVQKKPGNEPRSAPSDDATQQDVQESNGHINGLRPKRSNHSKYQKRLHRSKANPMRGLSRSQRCSTKEALNSDSAERNHPSSSHESTAVVQEKVSEPSLEAKQDGSAPGKSEGNGSPISVTEAETVNDPKSSTNTTPHENHDNHGTWRGGRGRRGRGRGGYRGRGRGGRGRGRGGRGRSYGGAHSSPHEAGSGSIKVSQPPVVKAVTDNAQT